jgi:hypothetical protein
VCACAAALSQGRGRSTWPVVRLSLAGKELVTRELPESLIILCTLGLYLGCSPGLYESFSDRGVVSQVIGSRMNDCMRTTDLARSIADGSVTHPRGTR